MSRRALFVLLLGISTVSSACSSSNLVDRVTFVNESEYSAHVEVTDGHSNGWLGLASLEPASTTTVERVIDQGEVWIFRFDYVGKYQEEVRISRQDLERSEWRVEIPDSFADALNSMGVPPSP